MLLPLLLSLSVDVPIYAPEPTVNLSAIRRIECDESYGSGFIIADNTIATAGHVASGTNCTDGETKKPLILSKIDGKTDFALMTGELPDMPYIKYNCEGYKNGLVDAYGISEFHVSFPIFRQVTLSVREKRDVTLDSGAVFKNMRHLRGYIVPGMSGGPHIQKGEAVGLSNVGYSEIKFGLRFILPDAYGYELKDTFLCQT